MTSTRKLFALILSGGFVGLVGCAPKMDMETMKESMKVERPAALNQLDALVGTWQGEATMKFKGMDEVLKGHGTTEISWDCDNWVLVERGNYEMDGMGSFKSLGVWSYDIKSGKFHTFWADSAGSHGTGVVDYDPEENEWEYRAKSHSAQGNSTGRGEMSVSDGTMKWDWDEFVFFGLMKVMEMEGESHKM